MQHRSAPFAAWILAAICSGQLCARVAAQPSEPPTYAAWVEQGRMAFREEQFVRAFTAFQQAHELAPSARTWRGMGVAAFELGHYTEAKQQLEQALADRRNPLTPAQCSEVSKLLDWMRTSLAALQLAVAPTDAAVSIDGRPTNTRLVLLDAGPHRVRARAEGYEPLERSIMLHPLEQLSLSLELTVSSPRDTAEDVIPKSASTGKAADLTAAPKGPSFSNAQSIARPDARDSSSAPKLYERWWFWTAVGVVAAGGLVAGLALTTRSDHATPHIDAIAYTLRVTH